MTVFYNLHKGRFGGGWGGGGEGRRQKQVEGNNLDTFILGRVYLYSLLAGSLQTMRTNINKLASAINAVTCGQYQPTAFAFFWGGGIFLLGMIKVLIKRMLPNIKHIPSI